MKEPLLVSRLAHVHPHLRPGGGPAGYLYHLARALRQYAGEGDPVRVVSMSESDLRIDPPGSAWFRLFSAGIRAVPRSVRPWLLYSGYTLLRSKPLPLALLEQASQYPAVVFHHAPTLLRYLSYSRRRRPQRVFLMSHAPVDTSTEIALGWMQQYGAAAGYQAVRRRLAADERRAYASCDGLLVPNRGSLDGYFVLDADVRRELLACQIHEIPSGVEEMAPSRPREAVRKELRLPESARVAGFFGRYHPHKGYDLFLQAARMLEAEPDLHFISAGSGPLRNGPPARNYRDLGWRLDLPDLLQAVDVVVVPNRVAYCDLIILEAMSLGRPVVAFATGGHAHLQSGGVVSIASVSASALASALRELDLPRLRDLGVLNRRAYEETYNLRQFARRHLDFAARVLGVPRDGSGRV